jgi:hypothetical protein
MTGDDRDPRGGYGWVWFILLLYIGGALIIGLVLGLAFVGAAWLLGWF